MLFTPLLAAINLVLSTNVSGPGAPAEKVLDGAGETVIWIVSKKPRVKIETHQGFTFNVDFATHGVLCLAHVCADLKTEPKGLTLSFDPEGGMLSTDYDKQAKEFRVLLGKGKAPLCKIPLPLTMPATRVLLRQREQLALYAIPQSGDGVTLVWLGTVGYRLEFRNASQYDLCTGLKITMGKREVPADEFRKGIKMTALDQIEDVVVDGVNPAGAPFRHRYTLDYAAVQKRADAAYVNLLRAAGNTLLGGEEAGSKAGSTPVPDAAASPEPTSTPVTDGPK